MLALILSLLGVGGIGAAAFGIFGAPALLGVARSAFGILAKIPWQVYAAAALVGVLAFLIISRGHALARSRADEARLELVCAAVRDAAHRPHQDCRLAAEQIRALGASVTTLETALADQNARIRELGRKSAAQQATAAQAERQAAQRANQAESVAERLERSSRRAPAAPCAVSKDLQEQWQ
jgi:hypothetical protein